LRITVADQEHCKKELVVEFSSDEVKGETDRVAAQLARSVNVPGFRPGHVPVSVIKTRFKKDLSDEVTSNLLPRGFADAVQKNDLKVLGEPSVSDVRHGLDGSLGATINVEVAPEFELSSYKGLPLVRKVYKVTDRDVDAAIEDLQQRYAEMVPVEDRPSQAGDFISANLAGWFQNSEGDEQDAARKTADGETADGDTADKPADANETQAEEPRSDEAGDAIEGKADSDGTGGGEREPDIPEAPFNVQLGQKGLIADFNEAFLGVNVGDERDFIVNYPKDYHSERFAGKAVRYKGEVASINIKEPPDVPEMLKLISDEEKTVEEFRSELRSQLEVQAESKSKEQFNNALLDLLLDRNRFELPSGIVALETRSRMTSLIQQWSRGGVDFRKLNIKWDQFQEAQQKGVERDFKASFILDRIADLEGITVTDEEIDERIQAAAASTGEDPAVLRARLTKEKAVASMKAQVRNERALDLLIASADVRVEEVDGLNEAATKSGEGEQGA